MNLLFLGTEADRSYLPYLKQAMGAAKCFLDLKPIQTLYEVEAYCNDPKRQITGVVSTSETLLQKVSGKHKAKLTDHAGSWYKVRGIEYVFVPPLEQVRTVTYGKFILNRFVSKLTNPSSWFQAPAFNWCVAHAGNLPSLYEEFHHAIAIAIDIETFKENLAIRCIGYTAIFDTGSGYTVRSIVLPINDIANLYWMRKFNRLPAPKIFQNGKYDNLYLTRYDAEPVNYLWDTINLSHCIYSELPKDLGFIQAFWVREASYWKDLADTNDLEQYYLYNAKDTWATACAFLAWMIDPPKYAINNYLLEFPVVFPCILSELTGMQRDMDRVQAAHDEIEQTIEKKNTELDRLLGTTGFNVNSPKQMKALMSLLGCEDLGGADEKAIAKAIYRHPLNARILNVIRGTPKTDDVERMGIRSLRKMQSTYLTIGDDAKEYRGRILYGLHPHGTDTARLASSDSAFWCGFQIQNIPTGRTVKQTLRADEGFFFGECDLEQAETRDTAYITGDENLLKAISTDKDFHSLNVSAFFGMPYESIYDDVKKKTLNKPLRDVGKRVNHGANYNMGPDVLVDTMGLERIYEAARLLKLNPRWTAREIAQYLLDRFDATYPVIRGDYHRYIKQCIQTTRLLVGATGWTRYCFGDPTASKTILNSYVAHPPQSLNAITLNRAYLRVFHDIAIHPEHSSNFKLISQIHDSILFQYREGHEYLADMVKERMEIPIRIADIKGKVREFTVPAALKLGKVDKDGNFKRAKYWSETE